MKTQEINYTEALTELGFTLRVNAGPTGDVQDDGDKAWPHIAYEVELLFNDKSVLKETYRLGVGHVKPLPYGSLPFVGMTADEQSFSHAWTRQPGAQFREKQLWASTAAKLAKSQGVKPKLSNVLHSLLSDGEAYFNAQTFENWACELGYDPDSRKAEAIYHACDTIGRKLANAVPAEVLSRARELLQDY